MDINTTNAPALYHGKNSGSWLSRLLGLHGGPVLRLYHSYGHADKVIVMGHALAEAPTPDDRYHRSTLNNSRSLLKLFAVKPMPHAKVRITFGAEVQEVQAADDGFFITQWDTNEPISKRWLDVKAELIDQPGVRTEGRIYAPSGTPYAIVSDIDDTILISYSNRLVRRMSELLSSNARTRRPFPDAVAHYQALANAHTTPDKPNPFFYVSSSEWNLYDYLKEFCRYHQFPEGVFLLSQIKGLTSFWKTGGGKHEGKYIRIVRVLEEFPTLRYILLGDDTQKDPEVYAKIAQHFPERIHCVYIRHRAKSHLEKTRVFEQQIKDAGIEVCYFTHSKTALEHSKRFLGL